MPSSSRRRYDPRYRPWYAVGASGPKDVLVVIDTSGSMVGTRISLAREAARYVLDTLTDGDYGGVVTFSSSAYRRMVTVAVLAVPHLTTTSSSDCI